MKDVVGPNPTEMSNQHACSTGDNHQLTNALPVEGDNKQKQQPVDTSNSLQEIDGTELLDKTPTDDDNNWSTFTILESGQANEPQEINTNETEWPWYHGTIYQCQYEGSCLRQFVWKGSLKDVL